MANLGHVQEIQKHHEDWVQAIWAGQLFQSAGLKDSSGQSVVIHFPGWLNRDAGPDFKEAHVTLNGVEFYGAIEIHLKPSLWYAHRHHQNPAYNAVVLHVVLDRDSTTEVLREDGTPIPEIVLRPRLKKSLLPLWGDETELLENYDHLPGKCGLYLQKHGMDALHPLLRHAAEQRVQRKMERIEEQAQHIEREQLLFQLIFKTLGYSVFSHCFDELAQLYPLKELISHLDQYRKARNIILPRWFGSCGLLADNPGIIKDPSLRKEYQQLQHHWQGLSNPQRVSQEFAKRYRPQNSPERRLIGMFYHLYHLKTRGLLNGWLDLLSDLESISNEKQLRKVALAKTEELFAVPDWEIWQSYFSWTTPVSAKGTETTQMQLIGSDRQLVLWANVIIPFFLMVARQEKWVELEKLLYRLFLILPPEGPNKDTRFMEKRLLPLPDMKLTPKSIGTHQGLIQIHRDFCLNFADGCQQCQLVSFLHPFADSAPSDSSESLSSEN